MKTHLHVHIIALFGATLQFQFYFRGCLLTKVLTHLKLGGGTRFRGGLAKLFYGPFSGVQRLFGMKELENCFIGHLQFDEVFEVEKV